MFVSKFFHVAQLYIPQTLVFPLVANDNLGYITLFAKRAGENLSYLGFLTGLCKKNELMEMAFLELKHSSFFFFFFYKSGEKKRRMVCVSRVDQRFSEASVHRQIGGLKISGQF